MERQIEQCAALLETVLGDDLLGLYLYGSAVTGELQRYSDIDLFAVVDRPTSRQEKAQLIASLLEISGIYMAGKERPIELTIVERSAINPWRYPPHFDFQYGEWLREELEGGEIEPWPNKEMSDLAPLITQLLLAHKILFGPAPDQLLCPVPRRDLLSAMSDSLESLQAELEGDVRNVLLTLARIWCTMESDAICSKAAAAQWAIERLPAEQRPPLERARAICVGEEEEHWDDLRELTGPCADWMVCRIREKKR